MKKLFALILVLALALSLLAACGKTEDPSESSEAGTQETSQSADTNAQWKDADGNWVPKQPVKDMTGKTFTIIVKGGTGTYQSDDFTDDGTLYGEVLNNAVRDRNNKVEEIYKIELNVVKSDSINNDIRADLDSSGGDYDAIMPNMSFLSTLASEENLYDLTQIANFDINAPWYDKNATKAFSIGNAVYFTTGDLTILSKVNAPSILFNKEMVNEYKLENLYDLVREKKWTFDKMVELGKKVSSVSNDDPFQNNYGMLTSYGDAMVMFGASGELIVDKDEDDMPMLKFGSTERSLTLAQKVLKTMEEGDNWLIFAQDPAFSADVWVISLKIFSEGHALFRPSYFSATTKLRKQSDITFGILPHPLMDETQTEYVSYSGTGETAGIAIPISANDPEFSAYMIDAYSAWAKNYVTHAYYDIILYQRDARDNESEEMLDIIFSNIVYDMGECFNFGKIKETFYNLARDRSSDITSAYDSIKGVLESDVEELRETFMK
ncbi:MAG: extracellular solute-binding protein [Clostridia bacterium]|nr:extracellular solute-binding protein [Clostridia bacterium]